MTKQESLVMKLDLVKMELRMARRKINEESKYIEQLRKERARVYEQEAAQDREIAQKFDDYKVPRKSFEQASYDAAKPTIKLVYYTLREFPDGFSLTELRDVLATRTNREISDAIWFLIDGGDIFLEPKVNGKYKVEK